jgi:hypothetical protein
MLVIMTLNSLPLVLVAGAVSLYRKEGENLGFWRRLVFLTGIIFNMVSAAVLMSFTVHALAATKPVDLDRLYPVLEMMGASFLASIFGCCGKRASRVLLVVDGLLTTGLWYFAALGASP